MTDDEKKVLEDAVSDLRRISGLVNCAPQPQRAIIQTQLFLAIQKVRFVLGEKDE